jgi:integrase
VAVIEKRVTHAGRTRYRVKIRIRGTPEETASFRRLTDAKRWAQRTEAAIRDGRHFPRNQARRRTLDELLKRYGEDVLAHRAKGTKKLTALLSRWAKELGPFFLMDITPAKIGEVRDALARETSARGEQRAPATVNRYLAALSHAFTIAVNEWGWAEENPVRKVRRLGEPRGRVRCLSDEDRARLFAACRQSKDRRLFPLVLLAVSTGARQGELLRLRWRDVDLKRCVAILQETKNGERRALPLAGPALEELGKLSRLRYVTSDLMFATKKGIARFPQRRWEKALQAADLEDLRFHDLRHTAASYLAMSGATLAEIAEVLGHKTLAMVKRYSHLSESHTHMVVERMNERFLASGRAP